MYEQFYGLTERPFDLTVNPKFLFLTPSHREALGNLQYGISARVGVTVLVGEAGTGKSTLIRATLESKNAKTYAVYLNNPALTRDEFLRFLAREFHLGPAAADCKAALLDQLARALIGFRDAGLSPALIIDEAQSLPHELLEEVRLLSNIETSTEKLLSIVLVGQPELAERLNERSLRQLKQRVELRCELRPLTLEETGAYIASRVRVAGADATALFTREAVGMIHRASHGIPRTISVLCNNALTTGFALKQRLVGPEIVREVCRDFDLEQTPAVAEAVVSATPPRREPRPAAGELLRLVAGPLRRFSFFQQSTD
jgi:general secretion pathway protein A